MQEQSDEWIKTEVISGLGVGRKYIGDRYYREYLLFRYGIDPYPGTLNLKLLSGKISWAGAWEIPGDDDHGPVMLLPVILARDPEDLEYISGMVLRPLKTTHGNNIIEVISDVCIRDFFGLRDGDIVYIKITGRRVNS